MLVLKAYLLLIITSLRLHRRAADVVAQRSGFQDAGLPRLSAADQQQVIVDTALSLRRAERCFPLHVTCLVRSLVFSELLARRGIETCVRIGVRKRQDVLEAHAWVEHNGHLIGSAADHSQSFLTLDPPVVERQSHR